jgi:hypothetical protein
VLLRPPRELRHLQAALLAAAPFGYAVLVGGDFMCMGRFLVPALPFLGILLAGALQRLLEAETRRLGPLGVLTAGIVALSVLPAFDVHLAPESLRARFHFRWRVDEYASEYTRWVKQKGNAWRWAQLGRALAWHAEPGDSLTIGRIGAIGYYSGLVIHDRLGLVTREVALVEHEAGLSSPGHDNRVTVAFFLDKEPTFLYANLIPDNERAREVMRRTWIRDRAQLAHERERLSAYVGRAIPLPAELGLTPGAALWVVERKDRDRGERGAS